MISMTSPNYLNSTPSSSAARRPASWPASPSPKRDDAPSSSSGPAYIGGLPANGLGATDIHTRGATGGLFLEFVGRIKKHYSDTYGADSQQVIDCSDGYRFEPHVAERVLLEMIAEQGDKLEVRTMRQFNHEPHNAIKDGAALRQIKIIDRENGAEEIYSAAQSSSTPPTKAILAAAAGAPYMLGREGADEYGEPCAGKFYQRWDAPVDEYYSTGQADNAIQSYNYRLAADDRSVQHDAHRKAGRLQPRRISLAD